MIKPHGKFGYTVNGVTLLELMLVLIVIVAILVVSSKLFFNAQNKNYTMAIANELQNVLNAAERYAAFNTTPPGGYSGFSNNNVPNLPTWLGWLPLTNTIQIFAPSERVFVVRVMWGPLRENCSEVSKFLKNNPNWSVSCPTNPNAYSSVVYNKY